MQQNILKSSTFLNNSLSILAWFAFLLVLLVLFMGDDILQEVATIYPDWAFPAFFIPWFLLVISSVQKLRENKPELRLQIWILKTTIPIFLFVTPFFSQFLNASTALTSCIDNCAEVNDSLLGFEVYCAYLAMVVLFLAHFLPSINSKQKLEIEGNTSRSS